jgi:hypothetical protein
MAMSMQTNVSTPVDAAIQQILQLGVGGVVAAIMYWQWQREIGRREAAEKRERAILRTVGNLPPEEASAAAEPTKHDQ